MQISKEGREILNYFIKDRLTIKQIAQRRKVTYQAVNKIIQKLKKKGIINLADSQWIGGVVKSDPYPQQIRLHAQHWLITPLVKTIYYRKNIGKTLVIDSNTIKVNQKNIEVYSNRSFYGKDASESDKNSLEYWLRFLTSLEHRLRTPLLKENRLNLTLVNAHYSHTNNPLAKKCLKEEIKIRLKALDGKTWLVVDNSFNLKELETTHPQSSKADMRGIIEPFFNDLKNNTVPLPSEAYKMQLLNLEAFKEIRESLNIIRKRLDDRNL